MCGGALMRILLGLLFFGVHAGAEAHSIQIHPASVVVRHGGRAAVNCTVSGDHEGIGWEASEGAVGMVSDQFVTWNPARITDWEIGPRCYRNFLNDTEYSQDQKALQITLYKPPDSVSISSMNHTGPMLEGEQYQLQCEVQNIAPVQYLTVKWYKGETLENQTSYDNLTKTPVNVSPTLLITPSRADDGVQYSCVAELELGPEGPQPPPSYKSDPLNITVHYKPRITECLDHVKLREGESLDTLVYCRAEGNPSPMVTRYRDQSEFSSSTQLTRRDAGQYVMTAINTLGSVSVNFTVGYGPIFNCSHKYEVTANERHALRCRAEGFPLPEVTWFKEDKEVELPAQMTWADKGQYILTARNAFGTANHSMDIDVLYPPSEIFDLESDAVDLGASVVLKCSSQGNPQPRYNWTHPRAANVLENSVDKVSLLHIFNASEENNGSYTCYAQNRIGHVNKTVSLIVRGKNTTTTICSIKMEPSTVVVRYGDPVSVNCTVSGDHEGIGWNASEGSVDMVSGVKFITWSLETLTDWEIRPKCYAKNKTGFQCDETLNITVYKPPDSVSISAVNHTGPMLEGEQYQLQCEVQNIAPVQYLTVKWYKGEILESQTSYDNLTKTPVNVSSTLLITPSRAIDGVKYSCVAELELGPEGPQPPHKSDPLNFPVHLSACPLKMEPSTVVVRYGDPVSVNCTVSGVHEGIGWEASDWFVNMESDVQFVTWSSETLKNWETSPKCFGNFPVDADLDGNLDQCDIKLNITVYKPPDSVSISAVNHTGPMLEGKQYQLQCEVRNIAPVQNLTVKWYKGETLENQTSYHALTKKPVNVSSTLLITPTSADDGAQYSCVAELELGPEGPQPPPSNKSDPLNITVNYAPIFNVSNETLKVAEGEEVTLNCSAVGNPLPEYSWSPPHNKETLITSTSLPPGTHVYTCNAKNYLGESRKYFTVEVIVIVDYLPLIAGIVALVVVCISIAFGFIYLIYYKNTKMGEYNLKLGKSRAQNAHVAQNGRDSSLPMKKLTKPSLPV